MRNLIVIGTNRLIGLIVEEFYRTELPKTGWNIQGFYEEDLGSIDPIHTSVLVVDTRLDGYLSEKYKEWCDRSVFVIPFDECDFTNIHDSIEYLLSQIKLHKETNCPLDSNQYPHNHNATGVTIDYQ